MVLPGASRVFISYSHDGEPHRKTVLDFANRLREEGGVDAWIDRFQEHAPPESWPDWMRRELDRADFVLVVVTERYVERFHRESAEGVGNGVRWEGALITSELYRGRRDKAKFLPVVLRAEDQRLIPAPLDLTSWFVIGETGDADIEGLVGILRRQPHPQSTPAALGRTPGTSAPEFGDIPCSPQLEAALEQAARDDVSGALRGIEGALAALRGDQRAHAVLVAGTLHQRDGAMMQAITCFTRVLETTGHPGLRTAATSRLERVRTEFDAHYGDRGPVAAAHAWLLGLRAGDGREAWKGLDRTLRLALAQDWILGHANDPEVRRHDRDDLAGALAEREPAHPLAEPLLAGRLAALRAHYADWDPDTWGAASTPRRIGLDHEVVVMAPADGGILVVEGQPLKELLLLLRRVGLDWRVANFRPAYPVPGWPPRHEEIPPAELGGARGTTGEGTT